MKDPKIIACANWEAKLIATHPNDLSPAEREEFNLHVASCPSCASVLAEYQEMDSLIRSSLISDRPLEFGDELVGALFVNFRQVQHIDASQELEVSQYIDRELNRTVNLKSLLHTLLNLACEQVPAEKAAILLYTPLTQVFEVAAAIGPHAETRQKRAIPLQESKGITRWVLEQKKPARASNVRHDSQWRDLPIQIADDTLSELDVPLLDGEEVVGILNVESTREGTFNQEDEDFLLTLAEQAVLAIRKAQAYAREKRLAEENLVLSEMSQNLTSQFDLAHIFDLILEKALDLTYATLGTLYLYDSSLHELRVAAEHGRAEDKKGSRSSLYQGIVEHVATHRQLSNIEDVSQPPWDKLSEELAPATRAALVVPMLAGDNLRGVLNVESPLPHHFSKHDEHLLIGLADLAVVALQSAEYYERIQAEAQRFELLYQAGQELSKIGNLEQLQQAYDSILRIAAVKDQRRAFPQKWNIHSVPEVYWQQGNRPEQVVLNLEVDEVPIKHGTSLQNQLAAELEDLLCRLFYRAKSILVRPLTTGHSGMGVLRVRPFFTVEGGGGEVIVKFGDARRIEEEYYNFKEYVQPFIGGGRGTTILDVSRTPHLGGIIYSLLGTSNDQLVDFGEFYRRASVSQIKKALDQLFQDTCGVWYEGHGNLQPLDLTAEYQRLFEYSSERLEPVLSDQLSSVRGKRKLSFKNLEGERTFTNPLRATAELSLVQPTYTCITHGDLNQHNMLVDSDGHIWLIDFRETGQSHILRDVAMLDAVIRFQLLTAEDATLEERLHMEEALCDIERFTQVEQLMTNFSTENPVLAKIYATIVHLRIWARRMVEQNPSDDMNEYSIALLYNALNTLRFSSLSSVQREHALLSASLLADRLELSS